MSNGNGKGDGESSTLIWPRLDSLSSWPTCFVDGYYTRMSSRPCLILCAISIETDIHIYIYTTTLI